MDPIPSSNQPAVASSSSEKPGMSVAAPPPAYLYNPAGYPPSFPSQPVPLGPGITMQPAVFVAATPLANPVPDYLAYSIFITVCCCLPLGVAALIYSCSTITEDYFIQSHSTNVYDLLTTTPYTTQQGVRAAPFDNTKNGCPQTLQ
ncbi:hypothetical protein Q8A67_008243 [Cirrhinus molitorella]|uniref:Uncharacterized protein n=1 Tax=Cirrhinus molitorella TaxID=172907 RepID=A0AA88Q3X4_9TELE|nr:hypothetical protein Q8A67_008243 [Cirrhinus molitorella]